jgi:hypothetical protein
LASQFAQFGKEDLSVLVDVVGESNISTSESELLINGTDALGGDWKRPDVVVWPKNTEQVSKIVAYANHRRDVHNLRSSRQGGN